MKLIRGILDLVMAGFLLVRMSAVGTEAMGVWDLYRYKWKHGA